MLQCTTLKSSFYCQWHVSYGKSAIIKLCSIGYRSPKFAEPTKSTSSHSTRLSQSYHDAYSNMQGYARLNRASITNTTVQAGVT